MVCLIYANLSTYASDKNYKISEVEGSRYLAYYNFENPYVAGDLKFRQALDTLVNKTYSESF